MNYDSFQFTAIDYAERLTNHTHVTLGWLVNNGYISVEDYHDLSGRLIVTPIKNSPSWGRKILNRFFGNEPEEITYVFPLVLLSPEANSPVEDDSDDDNNDTGVVIDINSRKKPK